jgi:hypothetical protein
LLVDGFEVKLSDGSNVYLMMCMDEASKLGFAVPTPAQRAINSEDAISAILAAWINWVGEPEEIQFDPARFFTSARFEEFILEHGMRPIPTPAEAHWHNGVIEPRVDFWKLAFVKMAVEAQVTEDDDPLAWTSKLNFAVNSRMREGGFSPFQFVFGREPRIPTSLLSSPDELGAQSAATYSEMARRAEELSRAAEVATAEADCDAGVRRALLHRSRPYRGA